MRRGVSSAEKKNVLAAISVAVFLIDLVVDALMARDRYELKTFNRIAFSEVMRI